MFGITESITTFVRQLRHKNMEILNQVKFTDDCYYSLDVKHGNETLEIEYNIQIKEWIITKHVENEMYMGRIHIKSGKNFDFSLQGQQKLSIDIFDISTGNKVESLPGLLPGMSLNLSHLLPGTYIFKVKTLDNISSYNFKMVKL